MTTVRWTSNDLEFRPENGNRYEIVDGELYASKQPHLHHQIVCGKLHSSPELVIEVLSPGSANEKRDRQVKLKLYSRHGAEEYRVVNWQERRLEIYRREEALLKLHKTLNEHDLLQSPLLSGFSCKVGQLFTSMMR